MQTAKAAGVTLPSSLSLAVMNRGMSQAYQGKDFNTMMSMVTWEAPAQHSTGDAATGKISLHTLIPNDPEKAAQMQTKVIMKVLLDGFRQADMSKPDSAKELVELVLTFKPVKIAPGEVSEGFNNHLNDIIKICECAGKRNQNVQHDAPTIRAKIEHDKNHFFHKFIFLLPAGRSLLAMVDEAILEAKTDSSAVQALDSLHSSLDNMSLEPIATCKLDGPILDRVDRVPFKTFLGAVWEIDAKLSDAAKEAHKDKFQSVMGKGGDIIASVKTHVRSRLKSQLAEAIKQYNQALTITSGGGQAAQKPVKAKGSLEKIAEELKCSKELGIHDLLGVKEMEALDNEISEIKKRVETFMEFLPCGVETVKKKAIMDLKNEHAKSLAEWFVDLGTPGQRPFVWDMVEITSLENWLKDEVVKALASKVLHLTAPYQRMAFCCFVSFLL